MQHRYPLAARQLTDKRFVRPILRHQVGRKIAYEAIEVAAPSCQLLASTRQRENRAAVSFRVKAVNAETIDRLKTARFLPLQAGLTTQ